MPSGADSQSCKPTWALTRRCVIDQLGGTTREADARQRTQAQQPERPKTSWGTAAGERETGGAVRPSKTNPPSVTGKGRAWCSTLRGEGRRSRSSGLWDDVATRRHMGRKDRLSTSQGERHSGALYSVCQKRMEQQGTRVAAGRKLAQLGRAKVAQTFGRRFNSCTA